MNLPQHGDEHRRHFHALTRDEQAAAIRRLADEGMSELALAAATGLSVEMVRSIIGERPA